MTYYNENEPYAADWLVNLGNENLIALGSVDRRSITDVRVGDIGAGQAHFFAGLGGWSWALRRAGVADDAPVWTGSCPCQPFSVAGKRGGAADVRHLWPVWFNLIRQRRPAIVFGEQVASRDGIQWFDDVSADLEGSGYAVAAADLCAAGVGAPHERQRLFFVAYAVEQRCEGLHIQLLQRRQDEASAQATRSRAAGDRTAHRDHAPITPGATRGLWADADWLACTDGFARPVEPGTFPLAHGLPGRVGRLRAYGNAINAEVAIAFIREAIDSIFA